MMMSSFAALPPSLLPPSQSLIEASHKLLVFVEDALVPVDLAERDVEELMSSFGVLNSCRVSKFPMLGRSEFENLPPGRSGVSVAEVELMSGLSAREAVSCLDGMRIPSVGVLRVERLPADPRLAEETVVRIALNLIQHQSHPMICAIKSTSPIVPGAAAAAIRPTPKLMMEKTTPPTATPVSVDPQKFNGTTTIQRATTAAAPPAHTTIGAPNVTSIKPAQQEEPSPYIGQQQQQQQQQQQAQSSSQYRQQQQQQSPPKYGAAPTSYQMASEHGGGSPPSQAGESTLLLAGGGIAPPPPTVLDTGGSSHHHHHPAGSGNVSGGGGGVSSSSSPMSVGGDGSPIQKYLTRIEFIDILGYPEFNLSEAILGPRDQNVLFIIEESQNRAEISLKGLPSESVAVAERLHLAIASAFPDVQQQTLAMTEDLLVAVFTKFTQWLLQRGLKVPETLGYRRHNYTIKANGKSEYHGREDRPRPWMDNVPSSCIAHNTSNQLPRGPSNQSMPIPLGGNNSSTTTPGSSTGNRYLHQSGGGSASRMLPQPGSGRGPQSNVGSMMMLSNVGGGAPPPASAINAPAGGYFGGHSSLSGQQQQQPPPLGVSPNYVMSGSSNNGRNQRPSEDQRQRNRMITGNDIRGSNMMMSPTMMASSPGYPQQMFQARGGLENSSQQYGTTMYDNYKQGRQQQ